MNSLLEIKNIEKIYGEEKIGYRALKDISLKIHEGDFLGIMGPSGAGKSTLLNIIATVDKATKGEFLFNGNDVTKLNDDELCDFRRKNIGFIFQDSNLIDTLTIRDNILATLELIGLSFSESNSKAEKIAKKMGIYEVLDKYPYECSGGQRQRGAACRALSMNPTILVADEPTGALDGRSSRELLKLLKELNENDGITIVMVTHDAMIASYSEKLIFIRDGEIDEVLEKEKMSQDEFYHKILEESSKEISSLFSEII